MHTFSLFCVKFLLQIAFEFHLDRKRRKDSAGEIIKTYNEISDFNETSSLQASEAGYEVTEIVTNTRIFKWDNKTAVDASAKCSLRVPCFVGGEMGFGAKETITIGRDSRKDNTKKVTKTYNVGANAGPMKHVTTTAHLMRYIFEIPYTATFKDKSRATEEGFFETESYKLIIKRHEEPIESK